MARLPTRDELGGLPSARSGRPIATVDTSAIGRGIADFGRSISGAAADLGRMAEEQQRKQNVLDVARAEAYKTQGFIDVRNEFDQDTDYATFPERAPKQTGSVLDNAKNLIRDDYARELWATTALSDAARVNDGIRDEAFAKQEAAQKVVLDDALETHRQIYVDPQTTEEDKSRSRYRIEQDIKAAEASGLLTPAEAQAARIKYLEEADFNRGKLAVEQNPNIIGPAASINHVVGKIVGAESGGDPNAKNPKSSAEGAGQFIDSTWLTMIRKYRPDIAAGKSSAEILALKRDGPLSVEMTKRYTEENAAALQASGNAVTPRNLYLSHFLGPGDAKRALSRDDSAPLEGFLSTDVLEANDFLKGKSVGWLKAWAERKMGGDVSPDWYKRLSPEQRSIVDAQADNYRTQRTNEQNAQFKAQQAAQNDNYRLRIATFDPTLTPQEILNDTVLDNGDKATLINSFNEKFDDVLRTSQAIQLFQQGQLALDPYDSKSKSLVDNVYDQFLKSVPEEQLQGVTEDLVGQTGILPKQVQNYIRRGLSSQNPSEMAGAAEMAYRLYQVDPNAMERRDGGAQMTESALTYDHMVNDLGYSSEEAAKRMVDMSDPAKRREREALLETKSVKDHLKNVDDGDVAAIYDTGIFDFAPNVGETEAARAAIVSDYKEVLTQSIVDAAGDMDLAKKIAAERFSKVYNISDLNLAGNDVVVKYPPEVAYPPGRDGTHEYIRNQALLALQEDGYTGVDDVALEVDPDGLTESDIRAGRPAKYILHFKRDGQWFRHSLPFYALPEAEVETPDLSGNVRRLESNRAQEAERQTIIDTGKPTQSVLDEMSAAGQEAEQMTKPYKLSRDESIKALVDVKNYSQQDATAIVDAVNALDATQPGSDEEKSAYAAYIAVARPAVEKYNYDPEWWPDILQRIKRLDNVAASQGGGGGF